MTNEQLALAGTYNEDYQFPVQMDWSDDRYDEIRGKVITDKVNYSGTVSDAAWSGGSETPASDVQGSYRTQLWTELVCGRWQLERRFPCCW